MSALICGSFAYDNIMVFPDYFKNHILPEKVHILNVSFMVPELRREFGGCAGNIAYNLMLLGGEGHPMGTVGQDFTPYARWMDAQNISRKFVTHVTGQFTAQAYITTDLDDNQITAFHPGAMTCSHHNKVSDAAGVTLGIVSPDGRDGMIQHAQQFAEAGIPFIFDPGQGMPMFDGSDLLQFVKQATWVCLNDYEWQLLQERTGLTIDEVTAKVKALIITHGAKGSLIHTREGKLEIAPATVGDVLDPTGCGDAYRAGLLYGLLNGLELATTGRIASLMGAIKIEAHGTQNHRFSREEFADRFAENYGYRI
ncbi:MAG: sugar kinase [Gammaproteobacteria bacterium RIFCSPLOWO2_02_FULL_56_15]|nr:MAG: sugar kinase [Gammaproteobacteria bacterium RIFCSPLOWO2_02_FULL_56_15]